MFYFLNKVFVFSVFSECNNNERLGVAAVVLIGDGIYECFFLLLASQVIHRQLFSLVCTIRTILGCVLQSSV